MDNVKVIERYIILLLGVRERPIPTATHLQKELFALTKANPRMADHISFDKHYYGPFSDDVKSISLSPIYHRDAYIMDAYNRLHLTESGGEMFNDLISDNSDRPRFQELLAMMMMVRDLYDDLSTNEVLFLVYVTYEEYTERSSLSDELLSPTKRRQLSKRLLEKGAITSERYEELVG
ncbi:MAG: hypothetical protein GQ558_08895 [Thermoplasmata archaeon]|nr:hypothetical protein [Thermoplasmata archaeon]